MSEEIIDLLNCRHEPDGQFCGGLCLNCEATIRTTIADLQAQLDAHMSDYHKYQQPPSHKCYTCELHNRLVETERQLEQLVINQRAHMADIVDLTQQLAAIKRETDEYKQRYHDQVEAQVVYTNMIDEHIIHHLEHMQVVDDELRERLGKHPIMQIVNSVVTKLTLERDQLRNRVTRLEGALNRIKDIAFEIPAPNPYTPQIVQVCMAVLDSTTNGGKDE